MASLMVKIKHRTSVVYCIELLLIICARTLAGPPEVTVDSMIASG